MKNLLIEKYEMQAHPEGGYYTQIYKSDLTVLDGTRASSTAIYFLLENGQKSHFHKIKSDEMWHFYCGGALEILEIDERGKLISTILGPDIENGQSFTHLVKAGRWFGSRPLKTSDYSFVGCTVSPGFDFEDFTLAKKEELSKDYPELKDIIEEMSY